MKNITKPTEQQRKFMQMAIDLAIQNIKEGKGGPFGAIVVRDGIVIGKGANHVTYHNDPTAHAEVVAIRDACRNIGDFQLHGCEIYASCEPCPMCLGAIYWARPDKLYYAATRNDAANIGFDDSYIYEQLPKQEHQRDLHTEHFMREEAMKPFEIWKNDSDKTDY